MHPSTLTGGDSSLCNLLPFGPAAALHVITHSQAVKCLCPCKERVLRLRSWWSVNVCSNRSFTTEWGLSSCSLAAGVMDGQEEWSVNKIKEVIDDRNSNSCIVLVQELHYLLRWTWGPSFDIFILSGNDVVVVCMLATWVHCVNLSLWRIISWTKGQADTQSDTRNKTNAAGYGQPERMVIVFKRKEKERSICNLGQSVWMMKPRSHAKAAWWVV